VRQCGQARDVAYSKTENYLNARVYRTTQALADCRNPRAHDSRLPRVQHADLAVPHRLLPASREGPDDRRTAEQSDELAPPHSITPSARKRTDGGIVRSRDFAVLKFTTSSSFVGCSTGTSAGLAPLRTLPIMTSDCRHIAARSGPYDTNPPPSSCSFHS